MMTNRFRTVAAAGLLSLAIGATAVPAGAATSPAPRSGAAATAKARCTSEIQRRTFTLTISKDWITNAKRVTAGQKASMIAGIDATMTQLTTVNQPAVVAAKTRAELTAACQAILTDNRVYAVVVPQLLLTVRAEQLLTGHDKLVTKSAEKAAAGADVTVLNQQLATAKAKIDPALASVAAVTPASFNADPTGTKAIFDTAAADLQMAFSTLLQAIQTYRAL